MIQKSLQKMQEQEGTDSEDMFGDEDDKPVVVNKSEQVEKLDIKSEAS